MQLQFSKKENDIEVIIQKDEESTPFSYLKFVQEIINGVEIEEPIFDDEIEEVDKSKIIEMLVKIRESIENQGEEEQE